MDDALTAEERAAGRVFEITIPHGVKPSAASCAWRVGMHMTAYKILLDGIAEHLNEYACLE